MSCKKYFPSFITFFLSFSPFPDFCNVTGVFGDKWLARNISLPTPRIASFVSSSVRPLVTKFQPHHRYMHHTYMHASCIHASWIHASWIHASHYGYMHHGYMHHGHICVGHTAWVPEGCEGRSQAGPKGRKLEVGAQRAPKLLVV